MEVFETSNEFGHGVVKSWASLLEDDCRQQAERISRVAIVSEHVALMPDAHFGFGPPVGSVVVTRGGVMPYAVGVDIGCGMIAARTTLQRGMLKGAEGHILGNIRELIPSGVGVNHKEPLPQAERFMAEHGLPRGIERDTKLANKKGTYHKQAASLARRAAIQFGTLGSGNHFVEVCEDREGTVWLLLHSGSRGIGNLLATGHVQVARTFCKENGIKVEHSEFAYVAEGSDEFDAYIADMLWGQAYAYAQREAMMDNLIVAVEREAGAFEVTERINCHHNYAEPTDDGAWLTRKGAIDASEGRMGIIPGSMGAATYIVRGRGNAESHHSSPHGAGRLLGRGQAKRTLDLDAFRKQMEGRTWLDRDAKALLDEAPAAYKPIETVIDDSRDLIEPVAVLSQFINYKGI